MGVLGESLFGEVTLDGEEILLDVVSTGRGRGGLALWVSASGRGLSRGLEDSDLRRWELWVGVDEEPDVEGAPDVTGSSLPLLFELPAGASRLFVRLGRRNGFGVLSVPGVSEVVDVVDGELVLRRPGLAEVFLGAAGLNCFAEVVYLEEAGVAVSGFRVVWEQDGVADEEVVLGASPATGVATARLVHEAKEPDGVVGESVTVRVFVRSGSGEGLLEGDGVAATVVVGAASAGSVEGLLLDETRSRGWNSGGGI